MSRVRGFAAWRPQRPPKGVLEEYHDYLPLTIRQVFYRLVGHHLKFFLAQSVAIFVQKIQVRVVLSVLNLDPAALVGSLPHPFGLRCDEIRRAGLSHIPTNASP